MNQSLDMSQFIEAKSDQLNSDDLIGRDLTVTITKVTGSDGDQPVAIHFEGDNGKPFKPCKTIRRVLVAVWGRYANEYIGRSMTLYRDDAVMFGGLQVGGIRIRAMSHLDKETVVVVAKSKGKKAGMKIEPLVVQQRTEAKPEITAEEWTRRYIARLDAAPDADALEALAAKSKPNVLRLIPDLAAQCLDALDARRADFALIAGGGRDVSEMGEGFTDGSDQ